MTTPAAHLCSPHQPAVIVVAVDDDIHLLTYEGLCKGLADLLLQRDQLVAPPLPAAGAVTAGTVTAGTVTAGTVTAPEHSDLGSASTAAAQRQAASDLQWAMRVAGDAAAGSQLVAASSTCGTCGVCISQPERCGDSKQEPFQTQQRTDCISSAAPRTQHPLLLPPPT